MCIIILEEKLEAPISYKYSQLCVLLHTVHNKYREVFKEVFLKPCGSVFFRYCFNSVYSFFLCAVVRGYIVLFFTASLFSVPEYSGSFPLLYYCIVSLFIL